MLLYIVKSAACLAVFYLFYKLFLERENMHLFKRWYLLLSLLLAFGIPFVTFTYTVPVAMPAEDTLAANPLVSGTGQIREELNYSIPVLWSVYGLGALASGFLFVKNLVRMLFRIKRNIKIKTKHSTKVLVRKSVIPHTFFSYIFLNKHKFETQQIPKEVLLHEEAHARQKHSLDIVCIEMLQVLLWFNPLIYLVKRAIKLNHEFLADRAVIKGNVRISAYQQMLLAFSSNAKQYQLANAINYSLIKKRFTVMKKQTSKRAVGLRSLILLPLLTVLLWSFSNKVAVPAENSIATQPENELPIAHPQQERSHDGHIEIFISNKGHILFNDRETTMRGLESKIRKISRAFSSEARQRLTASIYTESSADMKIVESVVKLLNEHGVSRITLIGDMPQQRDSDRVRAIAYERNAKAKAAYEREEAVLAGSAERVETESAAALAAIEAERAAEARELDQMSMEAEEAFGARELAGIEMERAALAEEMAETETERAEEIEAIGEIEVERAAEARELAEMEIEMQETAEAQRVAETMEIVEAPPPVSTAEHVMAMAEKDALFYYEGEQISSAKAIQLVKRKSNINVVTKKARSRRPVVYLSGKPIVIEE